MSGRSRRDLHPSLYCNYYPPKPHLSSPMLKFGKVNQPGTYWYHSHYRGQYPDGFRGPILIHDPASPYASYYDQELVLTMSDWYHKQMPEMIPGFLSPTSNPSGAGKSASSVYGNKEC